MLRIRLSRVGKKHQPSYRIVVADVDAPRDGRIVERIGHYNPLVDPVDYRIDEARALYWLSVGAQPSDAVERLLVRQGTRERLGRLKAGEALDELVAEFTGTEVPAAPVAAAAAAVADVAAEAEAVADEVVTEAEDVVDETVETVDEAVEDVPEEAAGLVETAKEAVESAVDAVEEVVTDATAVAGDVVAAVVDAVTDEEEE